MDKREELLTDYESLQEAFVRFSETSSRLERKYHMLLEETAKLREIIKQKDIEMKRQERLALLGETAAAIAHEVRNPLGSIKLFASLLKKDLEGNNGAIELIDHIDSSVVALDQVVKNILLFAKDQRIHFAPVNIHSIIREQVAVFEKGLPATGSIQLDLTANEYFWGNEISLRHVFHNLILNAFQASSYKCCVTIRSKDIGSEKCQIIVQDNGPGVKEGMLERIFDPFVTTKNEGTGLGLAVVRKILIEHQATIMCINENGAKFTMEFPRRMDLDQLDGGNDE